jgi:WD40 repeat protein
MNCYALSPNGTLLASGGTEYIDNTARAKLLLWDVGTGKELRRLVGHKHFVGAVVFSPDGKTLASSEPDRIHL